MDSWGRVEVQRPAWWQYVLDFSSGAKSDFGGSAAMVMVLTDACDGCSGQ